VARCRSGGGRKGWREQKERVKKIGREEVREERKG